MRRALPIVVALVVGFAGGLATKELFQRRGASKQADASGAAEKQELWTCSMHPQVLQDHPGMCPICHMELTPLRSRSHGAADSSHAGNITIDPVVTQNMGIRTTLAREGEVRRSVRAAGTLDEAEPNLRDVSARVSGWVSKLHANAEGVHVRRGEPLLELTSPEIQVAVDELIATREGDSLHAMARRKLALFGVDEEEIDRLAALDRAPSSFVLRSPIAGDVVEKLVVEGASVAPGDRLFRVVDHGTLWLEARVFERDLPFVKMGAAARAEVASRPGESFAGRVLFIHPHVDVSTRAAMVRLVVPNASRALKPGMEANVEIEGEAVGSSVLAPREAILDTGTRQVAFVAMGEGRFEPRVVRMGLEGEDGWVQVLDGIAAGEAVVTSGQFLLDSESRVREAIEKYRPGSAPGSTDTAVSPKAAMRAASPHGDAILEEYLRIAGTLGAVETKAEPVDPGQLANAAHELAAEEERGDGAMLARRVERAAKALAKKSLAEQRELFKELSDAVIAFAQARPPSRDVTAQLYVMRCPMAPGRWLQREEKLANPYYATSMKQCGSIVATIAALDPGR